MVKIKPFAIEIEASIIDKVIPHVVIDSSSRLNIMPLNTMEKSRLSITDISPYIINMADQSDYKLLGEIKNCKVTSGGEEYFVTFQVVRIEKQEAWLSFVIGMLVVKTCEC